MTWYCLDSPLWSGGFLDLRQKLEQVFVTQTVSLLTHKEKHAQLARVIIFADFIPYLISLIEKPGWEEAK